MAVCASPSTSTAPLLLLPWRCWLLLLSLSAALRRFGALLQHDACGDKHESFSTSCPSCCYSAAVETRRSASATVSTSAPWESASRCTGHFSDASAASLSSAGQHAASARLLCAELEPCADAGATEAEARVAKNVIASRVAASVRSSLSKQASWRGRSGR